MSVLVDTNVLLRRTQPNHPSHAVAVESVAVLLAADEPVYFTLQNIVEFWNVATRPLENNGLGFTLEVTLTEVGTIERLLTRLPDVPASYAEWRRLVVQHNVRGVKVHDARIVAVMNIHGVGKILTFNTADFARFEVEAVHPASMVA
jgi:predicted nucleic acid-binding protein